MSKVRADAWGEDLPEETRLQLYAYTKPPTKEELEKTNDELRMTNDELNHTVHNSSFVTRHSSLNSRRPWLRDFDRDVLPHLSLQGIVAPSRAGWYRFLGRMREREAAKTIIGIETSKRIAEGMTAAKIDPRLAADVMTSLAVDEAAKPETERNEKVMGIFASAAAMFRTTDQRERELSLKAAAQQTKDEQLKLAREKFEAAEKRLAAVKDVADAPQLTDEERVAKIKSIFGMK